MPASVFDGLADLMGGLVIPMILSSVSTCVRISRYGWQGARHFVASLITSTFTGVVVFWGLDYLDLSPTVDAAIVSVCAYMGGSLLDTFTFRVKQVVAHGKLGPKTGADE